MHTFTVIYSIRRHVGGWGGGISGHSDSPGRKIVLERCSSVIVDMLLARDVKDVLETCNPVDIFPILSYLRERL